MSAFESWVLVVSGAFHFRKCEEVSDAYWPTIPTGRGVFHGYAAGTKVQCCPKGYGETGFDFERTRYVFGIGIWMGF